MIDVYDIVESIEGSLHLHFNGSKIDDLDSIPSYAVIEKVVGDRHLVFYKNLPKIALTSTNNDLVWKNKDTKGERYLGILRLSCGFSATEIKNFMISKHDNPEEWNALIDALRMMKL